MILLKDYLGREQSFVKHAFLELYLERLIFKTASRYDHIVYVDGFAGPWQSANEKFEDTSFGIALGALRNAKSVWKPKRSVRMSAYLVERDPNAHSKLAQVPERFPDVVVKSYCAEFLTALPEILDDIPADAFVFFFIDPKGWMIDLQALQPMLVRDRSEVVFNFMFDFINRAVNIRDRSIIDGLNRLIPVGGWRDRLEIAAPHERKAILVEAFRASLLKFGNYKHVAEVTVLRPTKDRPLYCLFYATRHPAGIEVFRDCQIAALAAQSKARAATKVRQTAIATGQSELFESLHEMASDDQAQFLAGERQRAESFLTESVPRKPQDITWNALCTRVLERYVIRRTDLNKIGARLRADGTLLFPNWEKGKRVPQDAYKAQRP
jgi:three-Cys-motif partner protein